MIIIGASGHAKVVLDIITALGIAVTAVYDVDPTKTRLGDHPVIATNPFDRNEEAVIAIGTNSVRASIASQYKGTFPEALVHPSAVVSPSAKIGKGTVVMPGAIINADAVIGAHCIVNSNAVIEHDCTVGDYAHISPGASLAGNVSIQDGVHLGINATVIQGITIGQHAVVGAGAVVIYNIPAQCTAVGTPARPIKYHDSATK